MTPLQFNSIYLYPIERKKNQLNPSQIYSELQFTYFNYFGIFCDDELISLVIINSLVFYFKYQNTKKDNDRELNLSCLFMSLLHDMALFWLHHFIKLLFVRKISSCKIDLHLRSNKLQSVVTVITVEEIGNNIIVISVFVFCEVYIKKIIDNRFNHS